MRTRKWIGAGLGLVAAMMLGWAMPAAADTTTDRAASIVVYPKVVVNTSEGVDTLIQLSNTSGSLVQLLCFYVNANSHCSISGDVCDPQDSVPCPNPADLCLPGWSETDFRIYVTREQPIGWLASRGLLDSLVPILPPFQSGPTGETNAGTRIPPVPEESFIGELKCIVTDNEGRAIARNVIKGEATIVKVAAVDASTTGGGAQNNVHPPLDVTKYNAIGILGIEGDANGDNRLILGGEANEYNGCPSILIIDHFFDFATNPVNRREVTSRLTIVPCQQDLLNQVPGGTVVQYLVFNEFEQRFSTSTPIQCLFDTQLSRIDTRNPSKSIFSVFVAGTLTGQTRARGVSAGLLAVLHENAGSSAAVNVHQQGERTDPDTIVLP